MKIISEDSVYKVQEALVEDLLHFLLLNCNKKLLLFYSGGSVLEIFPLLLEKITQEGITHLDAWFVPIDERFDASASNYRAFAALPCYHDFEKMGIRFLDVLAHGHTLEDCGYWFSEWVRVETDQVQIADGKIMAIFGMGPDGHTAGIFPFPENEPFFNGEFINTKRYATAYDAGSKNQYQERITTTLPAFKTIDKSFAYVIGENKKGALKRVLEDSGTVEETPARVWGELVDMTIYTDISL